MLLKENRIPKKLRLLELFVDYLFICSYLLVLFVISIGFYMFVLDGIPNFSEWQSQLIATCFSVLPMIFIFSFLDFSKGSFGKRRAGLMVCFDQKSYSASLIRNTIKFLPWELGHIATIHGMYTNYDKVSICLSFLSFTCFLIFLIMGTLRQDKRHFGDLLAGTQVQLGIPSIASEFEQV